MNNTIIVAGGDMGTDSTQEFTPDTTSGVWNGSTQQFVPDSPTSTQQIPAIPTAIPQTEIQVQDNHGTCYAQFGDTCVVSPNGLLTALAMGCIIALGWRVLFKKHY